MAKHKCPNCGHPLKLAVFSDAPRQRTNNQRGYFQSNQLDSQPTVKTPDWLWVLFGSGRWSKPERDNKVVEVRSVIQTTARQTLINQLKLPVIVEELEELARLYVDLGYSWSRPTTTNNTSLSQDKHNLLNKAFLELMFVEQVNSRQYRLTEAGIRFLRHYLPPTTNHKQLSKQTTQQRKVTTKGNNR